MLACLQLAVAGGESGLAVSLKQHQNGNRLSESQRQKYIGISHWTDSYDAV
jgi:hypothetical protein